METIRNYLETMFQSLPNTREVQKAKTELWQMMEDKYTELKEEGKTENEAVGIVISEFGNLSELAEDLGIGSFVNSKEPENARMLSMQEVKDYLKDKTRSGFMVGLGTLLCIISPSGVIMTENVMGLMFLFVSVAIAVGIFIFSGAITGKWDFMKQQPCSIDFGTADYIHNERENYRITYALLNSIGVIFCILCFVPLVVMSESGWRGSWENFGVVILLALVAIGVFLIIVAGTRSSAYDTLLKLNDMDTMGGNFVSSQKGQVRYDNKVVAAIMSVYWPTVTCIYLVWSFLSYDWHITWIIWVIAGVIESFIKNLYRK